MADNTGNQQNINDLLKEQAKLQQRILELQAEGYSLSNSYIDSIKQLLGIKSKLSASDDNLLKLNNKINKAILDQKFGLDKISDVQKQISKNEDLKKKALVVEQSLINSINSERKKIIDRASNEIESIKTKTKLIEKELDKLEKGEVIDMNRVEALKKSISSHEKNLDTLTKELKPSEKLLLYTREQRKELDKQNEKRKKELEYLKQREKSLGLTGKLTQALSNIPGLGKIFGDPAYIKEVNDRVDAVHKKTGQFPGTFATLGIQFQVMGKSLIKALTDPLALLGLMLNGFLSLNRAQTDFRREVGRSVSHFDTINTSLITSADYIKQATLMTQQFGLAADLVFTPKTLQEATELVELVGLSAEQAGKLAMFSKVNGKELDSTSKNIIKQVNNYNRINKTAVAQKDVLRDVSNISNGLAITFGGNAEKIAAAVTQAKALGLSLESVDRVASSLLDFESSINAEISAELITGKALNLEKARLLALNDDLAGLTKEIGQNEGIVQAFSTKNRIAKEAIAKATGLSKDELAKMVFQQQLSKGLTEEQAAKASGMALEDMKRLTIQDSINKSLAKMGEALAGPLEMMAAILGHATVMKGIFLIIGSIISIQLVRGMAQFVIGLGRSIAQLGVKLGLTTAIAAAEMSGAAAATLGIGTVAIVAGAIAGIAAITSAINGAKDIGDGAFDRGNNFIVSSKEGGIFKPSPNDQIAVGPGVIESAKRPSNTVVVQQNNNREIVEAINSLKSREGTPSKINDSQIIEAVARVAGMGAGVLYTETSKRATKVQ